MPFGGGRVGQAAGGAGVVLVLTASGTATLDYSGSEPFVISGANVPSQSFVYRGTVTFHADAAAHQLVLSGPAQPVTEVLTSPAGTQTTSTTITPPHGAYTCTPTTLNVIGYSVYDRE